MWRWAPSTVIQLGNFSTDPGKVSFSDTQTGFLYESLINSSLWKKEKLNQEKQTMFQTNTIIGIDIKNIQELFAVCHF